MLYLLNSPLLGLLFFTLLLLLLVINNNKNGRVVGYKQCQNLIKKYKDDLTIIDIRDKQRCLESHINGSVIFEGNDNIVDVIKKAKKLLIVHDSDIELNNFANTHALPRYSDNVFQLNYSLLNLKQYENQYIEVV